MPAAIGLPLGDPSSLPGMDITGIATSYGIDSARVQSLSDLTLAVNQALGSGKPHLIEVTERRLAGS
jgi:thiamine pyrophosphate-dependent acetolactate synthase large subunit-like protein